MQPYYPLIGVLVALLAGLAVGKAWERYKVHFKLFLSIINECKILKIMNVCRQRIGKSIELLSAKVRLHLIALFRQYIRSNKNNSLLLLL